MFQFARRLAFGFLCFLLGALLWGLPGRALGQGSEPATFAPEWVKAWGPGHDFPGLPANLADLGANQAWDVFLHAGHLYVTGTDQARVRGDIDLFVRKYDLDGLLIWEEAWDNGPKDAGFVCVADADPGRVSLYVGGYTRVGNMNRALLQKRDAADGKLLWTKTWGEIPHGHHEIDGIAIHGDALYVSHYDSTWAGGNINAVVRKFDKRELDRTEGKAEPAWTTVWGNRDAEQDTTDGHIFADGTGVWVTGRIGGRSLGGGGGGDLYLTKLDPDGRQLWIKTWGGDRYDQGLSLTSDGEGLFVAGWTASRGAGAFDAAVVAFGMDGTIGPERVWGGPSLDYSRGVAADLSHVYAAAYTKARPTGPGRTAILKLDKRTLDLVGEALWEGKGDDCVTTSLVQEGPWLYLAGKTNRFKDGEQTFQPVLLKVSKDFDKRR
ncbi:MAG: hypothetical protein HY720_15145 [Planctomycetes bacterium]|nr:hypothetical protein [Planctomycetota bacterium]